MMRFTAVLVAAVLPVFFVFSPVQTHAAQKSNTDVRVLSGVKAVLKTDPSKGMVDLYLTDAATKKSISGAKVVAVVTLPDGKKVENSLVGMTMEGKSSYMEALDMGMKGTYVFDIRVEIGAKKLKFNFKARN